MDIKDNNPTKVDTQNDLPKKHKKKSKKCSNCNKRIGMIEFKCKCSDIKIFCSSCRYPKTNENDRNGHICDFDFQKHGREILEKNNPKIEHSKIIII